MSAGIEKARQQLLYLKNAINKAVSEIDTAIQKSDNAPGETEKAFMENLKDRLTGELESIISFEDLIQGKRDPTVGVFGSPSRGKSTLLNALLGMNMLPMEGQHGTTRFGTYLKKREPEYITNPKRPYNIKRVFTQKPEISVECSAADVNTRLKMYSEKEDGIERIELEGPFEPYIEDKLVFVDTPGIVQAGEQLADDDTHDWARDRTHALEALSKVDVVIFCMRADDQLRVDVNLYDKVIIENYEPINVITFANKRDEGYSIDDLKKDLRKSYKGLMLDDTVAVDAKKAVDIIAVAKKEGKNVKETIEAKFKGENLEGFKDLRDLIHSKLNYKDDASIGSQVKRFEELYNGLKNNAYEKCKLTLPGINEHDLAENASNNKLLNMVTIPPGHFVMGSPKDEIGHEKNEAPQRKVTLGAFYMSKSLVTQEQWTVVMGGANPSHFSIPKPGERAGLTPVENVSWYDTLVFANRLSIMEGLNPAYSIEDSTNPDDWGPKPEMSLQDKMKALMDMGQSLDDVKNIFNGIWGKGVGGIIGNFKGNKPGGEHKAKWDNVKIVPKANGYRLPTEAQWEYAVRAGTTTAFSNGATNWKALESINTIGWFRSNSEGRTREIGQKIANPWGLQGMHGNVREWVWDWYDAYPSKDEEDPFGPPSGKERVARGGSWADTAQTARSACRTFGDPAGCFNFVGFRLVRPLI
ncbi:MAG: SUMF1/EgtB/PvdO family nonheme iron enzyme [Spirochaetes bacterium]|nr:SUMF1/EgtB/PvdO family nonheme iron enzyme [Spirochaetota bacterium]